VELTPFTPLKLLRHTDRIEAMLRGEETFPISVELDLSNTCPHDCPFCSFGTSQSQGYRQQNWVQFPTSRALALIEELAECGVKSVTLTGGGEPLIHKEAHAIIRALNDSPLEWGLVTNGFLLKGPIVADIAAGATFVRISLDAGTPETHAFTHGLPAGQLQYATILSNMKTLRHEAGTRQLTIGASFCMMNENFKEVYRAAQNVRDHGGDYLEVRPTFQTDWRGDGWGSALSDPDGAKVEVEHARLHLNSPTFQVIGMTSRFDALSENVNHPYDKCRIGPLMTVIGATGDLFHCCVQRGQDFFNMGSLLHTSFREAWKTAQARKMSEQIDVSKCPKCRYRGYNELLAKAFVNGDALHANFV
jgi:radical SAM protein with 4Fe4S-binding SPASM domain